MDNPRYALDRTIKTLIGISALRDMRTYKEYIRGTCRGISRLKTPPFRLKCWHPSSEIIMLLGKKPTIIPAK